MFHDLLNPTALIQNFGYMGVFLTVFAESGIVFGFFLPGDSLLFAAGLLASQHHLSIFGLIGVAVVGAILGNNVGFLTGRKLGPALFTRKKSVMFSPKRVQEAHEFFQKQGAQSLILARFIPGVRTFIPIIAGVGKMPYRTFVTYNLIGGLLWGILVPILGYTLGRTIPSVDKYLLPIILLIVVISILPVALKYFKARRENTNE
ncbi:DedA family protein [Candidatus Saccharibacteria bacterium]|nr:DedA family protein [Candidatus Saccharibacteria bacterium]